MLATTTPSSAGRVAMLAVRPKSASVPPPLVAVKLLDQVRQRIRYLHYSPRTEDVYVYWIRLFIRFHKLRHPRDLGAPEVEAFLSWRANARRVAPSTHKQYDQTFQRAFKKAILSAGIHRDRPRHRSEPPASVFKTTAIRLPRVQALSKDEFIRGKYR